MEVKGSRNDGDEKLEMERKDWRRRDASRGSRRASVMNPAPDLEARKFKVMNACHKLYVLLKGLADFLLETKSAIKKAPV